MRRSPVLRSALAVALAALALASPCAAEEAEKGGGAAAQGHAQPGLLDVDFVVAGATVAVFLLLLVVLKKAAWKPILDGLRAREAGIRDQIEAAERANAEAKALLAQHQAKVDQAAAEARAIVEEGKRDAVALAARIQAEAKEAAATERERAVRDIEVARQGALQAIYDQVAVVATEVAGRILQQRLDPAQHRRLVDEAVGEYERRRKAPGARA